MPCDSGAEQNDEFDLIEPDVSSGEGLEEYQDVGKKDEDNVQEEGVEEEERVAS